MNKRQRKKMINKLCIKYQDGCGIMLNLRSPSINVSQVKLRDPFFHYYSQGIDFPVDMFYGKAVM
jgi:hypothetical protein